MKKIYYQCRLIRDGIEQVAWIESKGARLNARVEIIEGEDKSYWTVTNVYEPPIKESVLREKQKMDRASLPSIKG